MCAQYRSRSENKNMQQHQYQSREFLPVTWTCFHALWLDANTGAEQIGKNIKQHSQADCKLTRKLAQDDAGLLSPLESPSGENHLDLMSLVCLQSVVKCSRTIGLLILCGTVLQERGTQFRCTLHPISEILGSSICSDHACAHHRLMPCTRLHRAGGGKGSRIALSFFFTVEPLVKSSEAEGKREDSGAPRRTRATAQVSNILFFVK